MKITIATFNTHASGILTELLNINFSVRMDNGIIVQFAHMSRKRLAE